MRRGFIFFAGFFCSAWSLGMRAEPTFNIDSVKNLLQTEPITDMGELISRLPEEYRANYTLLHKSLSLHAADRENPRALLFGKTAKMIFAFNGDPKQRNYSALEVIGFNEEKKLFEFYSISFKDKITVEGPNPRRCQGCHYQEPRPIWEPYSDWLKAYAGRDDKMTPEDVTALAAWREKAKTHPRYQYLKREDATAPYFPFDSLPITREHRLRPNLRLSLLMTMRNADRLSNLILTNPQFEKYKSTALFLATRCSDRITKEEHQAIADLGISMVKERFHPPHHLQLYKDIAQRQGSPELAMYVFERYFTGPNVFNYNFDQRRQIIEIDDYYAGYARQRDMTMAYLFKAMVAKDETLRPYYHPRTFKDEYLRTFDEAKYEAQILPGDIGDAYNRDGVWGVEIPNYAEACAFLYERTKAELKL